MRFNWGTRKLTFVVIRDANSSVVRFRLRSIFLYLIPILLILACAAIGILTHLYLDSVKLSQALASKLQMEAMEHSKIVDEKDRTIEQLMTDVVELTAQAEQVQERLQELEQIGNQIKSISGDTKAGTNPHAVFGSRGDEARGDVMIASAFAFAEEDMGFEALITDQHADSEHHERFAANPATDLFSDLLISPLYPFDPLNGQGGTLHDVNPEEIIKLAADTKETFLQLDELMEDLKLNLEEAKELALEYQHLMRITPSIWPTVSTRITSSFGYRRDPFTRRLSHHSGIDFGGKTGDPIYATADGKIIESSYDRALGNYIVIDHSNGLRTLYAHLSKRLVSAGETVSKGDEIGKLGSTGRSTGPHLHYEVYKNGVPVNPKNYLP